MQAVGALYGQRGTVGGGGGLVVGDLDLVELVANGDCFVEGRKQEGLMVFVALFLKVGFCIFGNHDFVLFLFGRIVFPHIESQYQLIIFMLPLINSICVDF